MPTVLAYLKSCDLAVAGASEKRRTAWILVTAVLHLASLGLLLWSEGNLVAKIVFVLTWGLLNFFWLSVLRRPALSAVLSLALVVILIILSQLKHHTLGMVANFVDIMIIDADTTSFLMMISPGLGWTVGVTALVAIPVLVLLWWFDPFRVRQGMAVLGGACCFAALTALSLFMPMDREDNFNGSEYVSMFARSASVAAIDLMTNGLMESDSVTADRLAATTSTICPPARKLPHILMVLDESSFDISVAPGVRVPPDYQRHFRSFDGKTRSLLIEGAGGPTWYTEYNVLTGLSALSYGRFAEFVTRIAVGRIERSLPNELRRCGYRSFSMYPWGGEFLSARSFQKTVGVDHFLDGKDLGANGPEPDKFYYDFVTELVRRERQDGPVFVLTYLMANHWPWDYRYRPELAPEWRDLGNARIDGHSIDEYLRRQTMSARDYEAFVDRLRHEFPDEPFLIVRFGDHQPLFAKHIIDPTLDEAARARHIMASDPRFFTTYYAIDAVNFSPADLSSAIDGLDGPYLPLVVLEAAGLPLDSTFAEQKRILQRCLGLFYLCAQGAEVRHFNRLLIDAGLIKRL